MIPPHYDSLIAKVIVRDDTRAAAIERARRVLAEFEIVGVPTTRDVALDILDSPEFRSGDTRRRFSKRRARLPSFAVGMTYVARNATARSPSPTPRSRHRRAVGGVGRRRPRPACAPKARRRARRPAARVELELAVAYGHVLHEVAQDVQVRVTDALTQMCGLDVSAVDVTVEELDR